MTVYISLAFKLFGLGQEYWYTSEIKQVMLYHENLPGR